MARNNRFTMALLYFVGSCFLLFMSAIVWADVKDKDSSKHEKNSQLSISEVQVSFGPPDNLIIRGENLTLGLRHGATPKVTLGEDDTPLTLLDYNDDQIIVECPLDVSQVPTCGDGDYRLTVYAKSAYKGKEGGKKEYASDSYDLTIGAVGPEGMMGETGPIGATGLRGPQGVKGDTGAEGPMGPIGFTGSRGPVGPQGEAGDQGDPGSQGERGPVGPRGFQGPAGILNSYSRVRNYSTTSGIFLVEYWGEAYCDDENDIAVSGSTVFSSNDGYGTDILRPHDTTYQDPNYRSYHTSSMVCNRLFGCDSLIGNITIQCLSVP